MQKHNEVTETLEGHPMTIGVLLDLLSEWVAAGVPLTAYVYMRSIDAARVNVMSTWLEEM